MFFKLDFNEIEVCVKFDILKIEFYIYIYILSGTPNVEFHL